MKIELVENNAGGLFISADGVKWFDATPVQDDSNFADDAAALSAGDTADWTLDTYELDAAPGELVAIWEAGKVTICGNCGTAAKIYLSKNAPTVKHMEAAFFAQRTNEDAQTEGCTPDEIMRSFDYTAEHRALYATGMEILQEWQYTVGKRSTLPAAPADNQIVVDSGYIATSPAYRLVTFSPRKPLTVKA